MSVEFDIDTISLEKADDISKKLEVEVKNRYQSHFAAKKYLILYKLIENKIRLPFYYAYSVLNRRPNKELKFQTTENKFTAKLYPNQREVVKELLQYLNKYGCAFLSAHTGFGKTVVGTYLTCKIGLKTVILTHRVIIATQWIKSKENFTGSKRIAQFKTKDVWDDEIDIYVINPIILPKLKNFKFEEIGFLITDEAHAFCSPKMSEAFTYFTPKYSLGLSATPDEKSDGTGVVLNHYFGKRVYRKFYEVHDVYEFRTGFIPEFKLNQEGRTDWNSVLTSQATDEKRNGTIVKMCEYFENRNILVLCKRKIQAEYLLDELREKGIDADIYIASMKNVNYTCRVLIATFSKGGVGFDHPALNMLILASDVEAYIQQYIGRVFRGGKTLKEGERVYIVDLVDKFNLLENHYKSRKRYYKKIGGKVKKFEKHFNMDEGEEGEDFLIL